MPCYLRPLELILVHNISDMANLFSFYSPSFFCCILSCPMINPRSVYNNLSFSICAIFLSRQILERLLLRDFRAKIRLFFDICKYIFHFFSFCNVYYTFMWIICHFPAVFAANPSIFTLFQPK